VNGLAQALSEQGIGFLHAQSNYLIDLPGNPDAFNILPGKYETYLKRLLQGLLFRVE